MAAPITTMSFRALDSVDPDIANLIRKEYRRQSETLELIASENLPSPANFSGKLYDIHSYGVHRETELIDYEAMEKLAEQVRPKMIIGGFSAYSRVVDWARMRQIADAVGATFVVDMAHVAGLVAGDQYPSPIPHAAIVTTTTPKAPRRPWGAIILCDNAHQKAIDSAVFPGIQGGPLMHAIAAKAVCFGEALRPDFKVYAKQVVVNAKALAARLMERGLRLVSGGTDNHLMLVDLRPQKRTGKQVQDVADTVGITLNRNSIPYDEASKFNPSGVRVGTPLVTTRGMREPEMVVIADCLADLIERIDDPAVRDSVHERALDLCWKFPVPYSMD